MAGPLNAAPLTASGRIKGATFTYSTLLRDFATRSPLTVGLFVVVELAQVAFQSAIGLFVLLFLRKVGGDSILQLGPVETDAVQPSPVPGAALFDRLNSLAQSPQELIGLLSDQLSLTTLLIFFLVLVGTAAFSTFAASFLLNRRAREYEDYTVRRALTRLSNIGFEELANVRRWMPVDRSSALKLIQTDARMTAISARLLVYAVAAVGLMIVVLVALTVIDWRVSLIALGLLSVSTAPLLILMVFGSRHSDQMLERAPGLARAKQHLLDVALARPQRLESNDSELREAFAKGGPIARFMDTFETRFQLLSISGFVFNLVANLVLVAMGFFLLIEVLSGRLDPTLLVIFFVVLSLLVRGFRQLASFMTTVSRLHRPVETHQRFISATKDRSYENRAAVVTHRSVPAMAFSPSVSGVTPRLQLAPGNVYAMMSRETVSRFWAYEFYTLALADPDGNASTLDRTVLLGEIDDLPTHSIRELAGAQRGFFASDYEKFKGEVTAIWAADKEIEPLSRLDWPATMDIPIGSKLNRQGLAELVRVLGAARFSGAILFLHAALLKGLTAPQREALFQALDKVVVVFFDRRPRPDLYAMRDSLTSLLIKTPGVVTAHSPEVFDRPQREVVDLMIAQESEREDTSQDPTLYDAV